jgi:hypothetical protein
MEVSKDARKLHSTPFMLVEIITVLGRKIVGWRLN